MTQSTVVMQFEAGKLTYGALRALVSETERAAAARGEGHDMSSVNPQLTHAEALEILGLALTQFDDAAVVGGDDRQQLLLRNILKECF